MMKWILKSAVGLCLFVAGALILGYFALWIWWSEFQAFNIIAAAREGIDIFLAVLAYYLIAIIGAVLAYIGARMIFRANLRLQVRHHE